MNAAFGHNETAVRLGLLAQDAQKALARVASGEEDAIAGWLAYGAALNEGRAFFPKGDNERFSEWVNKSQLAIWEDGTPIGMDERAAAMWAANEPINFQAVKEQNPRVRTVRGIHAKWKDILAQREAEERRREAEAARIAAQKAREESQAREVAEAEARRAAQEAENEDQRKQAEIRYKAEAEAREKARQAEVAALQEQHKAQKLLKDAEKKVKAASRESTDVAHEKTAHVSHNSGENEWYTPPAIIEAARRVMGGIDLDPATSEIANQTVKATRIFTEETDGLSQEWPVGRIWMNPPYAQPFMGQFAERITQEAMRGSEAIVLVNNATETAWFQRMGEVASAVCFPKSRVKFLDPYGNPGAPLQGQAVIYFGPNVEKFAAEFHSFGMVFRNAR